MDCFIFHPFYTISILCWLFGQILTQLLSAVLVFMRNTWWTQNDIIVCVHFAFSRLFQLMHIEYAYFVNIVMVTDSHWLYAEHMEEASREEREVKLSSSMPRQRGKITKSFDRISFNSDFDSGAISCQHFATLA